MVALTGHVGWRSRSLYGNMIGAKVIVSPMSLRYLRYLYFGHRRVSAFMLLIIYFVRYLNANLKQTSGKISELLLAG